MVVVTGLVLLMSLALPKTYSAKATMVFNEDPTITTTTDAERQLATIQKLLVTRDVLATSAKRLPGESVTSLAGNVVASVDPTANIVTIAASGSSPERAARTANVVAAAFLARERAADIARIQSAENRLNAAIVGPEGHARWRGADRAHPRAAERAVRERGDRRLGASARRPGAPARDPHVASSAPQRRLRVRRGAVHRHARGART